MPTDSVSERLEPGGAAAWRVVLRCCQGADAFQLAHEWGVALGDEVDHEPRPARAGGASDPMQVIFDLLRQMIVDHSPDMVNIQPA